LIPVAGHHTRSLPLGRGRRQRRSDPAFGSDFGNEPQESGVSPQCIALIEQDPELAATCIKKLQPAGAFGP
jgi:hypothetical protein